MSFLIKEYLIPFLGKIKLIKATGYDKSFNGKYYTEKNEIKETICGRCSSVDELIEKTGNEIKYYFEEQASLLQNRIEEGIKKKRELELLLEEVKNLNSSEEFEKWLKTYQTENPLQLEKQKEVKIKWN